MAGSLIIAFRTAGKHQSRGNATEARHRIAMVTGIPTAPCTNPYGDYLLSLSIQNKQDYARLHSYELHLMGEAVTSHIRAGPWQKVGFIQKVRRPLPSSPQALRSSDIALSK